MAVQAQYPSNILLLNNRNVQESSKNILGNNDYSLQPQPGGGVGGGGGGFLDQSHMMFNSNGVGVVNPRKRNREVATTTTATATTTASTAMNMNMNSFSFSLQNHHHHHQQQQQQQHDQNHQLIELSQLHNNNHNHNHNHQSNVVSTGLRLSFGDQQQQQQQQQIHQHPTLVSLLSEDLSLQLKQQSDELNYFLHAQGEQMRRTLAEKRQRHYRALLGAAEEAVLRQVREKDVEVEKASKRNAELELRAAQLTAEAQSWWAKAQSQEAQAISLQAQIHHVATLAGVGGPTSGGAQEQEGEGGGLGCADSESSAYVDPVSERQQQRVNSLSCKACRTRAASVVLLPCRHLCVCVECDRVVSSCPVCLSLRSASVEVYLS